MLAGKTRKKHFKFILFIFFSVILVQKIYKTTFSPIHWIRPVKPFQGWLRKKCNFFVLHPLERIQFYLLAPFDEHLEILIILLTDIFCQYKLIGLFDRQNYQGDIMIKSEKQTKSLSKQLMKYSMAASGTLLLCTQASATPQYSGLQNTTLDNSSLQVDMDGDGTKDFKIIDGTFDAGVVNYLIARQATNFSEENTAASIIKDAPRFLAGQQIGPANSFSAKKYELAFRIGSSSSSFFSSGDFLRNTGFLGVKFKIGTNTHYGWIQIEGGDPPTYGKVIDWAYEDQPDTAILAGAKTATETKTATIPTLNEWGILILMALILEEGLRRTRRKNEAVPQKIS